MPPKDINQIINIVKSIKSLIFENFLFFLLKNKKSKFKI